MNFFDRYYQVFLKKPGRIAFRSAGEDLSYQSFHRAVAASRELLESLPGFDRSKPVAVVCHNSTASYAALFGIWFAGCAAVPLHPSHPLRWNIEIIGKTGSQALFNFDSARDGKEESCPVPVICNRGALSDRFRKPRAVAGRALAYILTTSGTTGTPKHVAISHDNVKAFLEGFLALYPDLTEEDRFLQTYDLTADAAFTGYLVPLCLGATVLTVPGMPFRYLAVARALREERVSWVQVTPSLLACLRPYFGSFRLAGLRHFHFGGEALPLELVEAWRPSVPAAEISNVYGPTETTVTALLYRMEPGDTPLTVNGTLSIGLPLPSVELRIAGPGGEVLQGEGTGELLIGGKQVMRGYWGDHEGTASGMLKKGGFYPTGDLVRRDAGGYYYFLERMNDQVKINGYRVDLAEVAQKAAALAGHHRCVAVAPETGEGLRSLCLFIEGYRGNGDEIRKQMHARYPPHLVPDRIIGVERFPLTLSGKTDKEQLIRSHIKTG